MSCLNPHLPKQTVVLCCLCALGLWRVALGQDIHPEMVTEADRRAREDAFLTPPEFHLGPPADFVSYLLRRYEFVADGQFDGLPEYSLEELKASRPAEVRIKFRINQLYKGQAEDSIDIRLTDDMLAVPGETISRNAKRHQILEKRNRDLKSVRKQIDDMKRSFEAGEIAEHDYQAERRRLYDIIHNRVQADGGISAPHIFVFDGKSFYDKGGAVGPGENYLIGVNASPEAADAYYIDEFLSKSSIFWGAMRDYILPGFAASTRHSRQVPMEANSLQESNGGE